MYQFDSRTLQQKLSTFAEQMAVNRETLGVNLSKMRETRRLTQDQLAERAYVSKKSISNWERGVSTPGWGNIERLASVLKCDISDLLDDPDAPSSNEPTIGERMDSLEAKLDRVLEILGTADAAVAAVSRQSEDPAAADLPEVPDPPKRRASRRAA
jgi:transcriptional regulator with XRE-family HTH domain